MQYLRCKLLDGNRVFVRRSLASCNDAVYPVSAMAILFRAIFFKCFFSSFLDFKVKIWLCCLTSKFNTCYVIVVMVLCRLI
jgi:hypothetical protein